MSAPARCLLLIDEHPNRGSWNMAVDEALLEAALDRRECFFRLYRWNEATLSLGYFQDAGTVDGRLSDVPRVRRLSGGGAILHHHELTYSCVVAADHPVAAAAGELYDVVHGALIGMLAQRGIEAFRRGEAHAAGDGERPAPPFLCFGRGDPRDVLLGGAKILGSAQRRRRGAVLQHGSLLLRRSPLAPEFPGLEDLTGDALPERWLGEAIIDAVTPRLGGRWERCGLSGGDRLRATSLEAQRYSTIRWKRRGRTPSDAAG